MQFVDAIAAALTIASAAAFWAGSSALARAEDLQALYWLVVGLVAVRGAVQLSKTGAKG